MGGSGPAQVTFHTWHQLLDKAFDSISKERGGRFLKNGVVRQDRLHMSENAMLCPLNWCHRRCKRFPKHMRQGNLQKGTVPHEAV